MNCSKLLLFFAYASLMLAAGNSVSDSDKCTLKYTCVDRSIANLLFGDDDPGTIKLVLNCPKEHLTTKRLTFVPSKKAKNVSCPEELPIKYGVYVSEEEPATIQKLNDSIKLNSTHSLFVKAGDFDERTLSWESLRKDGLVILYAGGAPEQIFTPEIGHVLI